MALVKPAFRHLKQRDLPAHDLLVISNYQSQGRIEQTLGALVNQKQASLWGPAFHLPLPVIGIEASGDS